MSVASTTAPRPSEPAAPDSVPARPPRRGALARASVLLAGIGAATFLLALNGGFYDLADRDALAIVVWWALGFMAVLGLWPAARVSRTGTVATALLGAFALFTALSSLWAPAAQTALTEGGRVLLYLGVFVLALVALRPRDAPRAADGLALGIAAVGLLALASRLFPDLTDPREVSRLLPGTEDRLTYPVDYWNGLGVLVALGVPLLLRAATSIEAGRWRAVALAPIPALSGVVYLTSSRGAAVVGAVGVLAFVALTDRRLLTLWASAVAAGGSALVIAVLHARPTLVSGPLRSDLAHSQGRSAALLIALVCVATAAVYLLGALRAPVRPRLPAALRWGVLAAVVIAVGAAVVAVDPSQRLDRFKVAPSQDPVNSSNPSRYVESHLLSGGGSGRWQFWGAAVDQFESQPLRGGGAGSFQSWWRPTAASPTSCAMPTPCGSRPSGSWGSSASPCWWGSSPRWASPAPAR